MESPVGKEQLLITIINFSLFILVNIEGSGTAARIAILLREITVYSVVLIAMNIIILRN
jgi:hypothetical protein